MSINVLSFKLYKELTKDLFFPRRVEAWILRMFCMKGLNNRVFSPTAFLPVCGVWAFRNIHISTPLFTGWRIPRRSQGALYLLLSDMVIQLFRNGTPFFLPRCLC